MRLDTYFNFYASVQLAAVSNIRQVAARIVGPADILENIKESKSFVMKKGEECVKLQSGITKNEKDTENVDVGVLGCGETLICLEDESSATGARCVDFVEVDEGVTYDCSVKDEFCMSSFDCCFDICGEGHYCLG